MGFSAGKTARITIVVMLAAALSVPIVAGAQSEPSANRDLSRLASAIAAAASDDTTAGAVPLVSSPVTGTLSVAGGDRRDYFSFTLVEGQRFTARLSGASDTGFDLFLYAPVATQVGIDDPVAYAWDEAYPDYLYTVPTQNRDEEFGFVARGTGTYFLEVYAASGAGSYTLDWAKGVSPSISLVKSQTITYGGTATFTGTVRGTGGAGLVGETVELLALPYNEIDDHSFRKVATTVTTTGGAYSFSAKPDRLTFYMAVSQGTTPGYAHAASVQRGVHVRVALTKPSVPSKVYRGKTFEISGYLKPRHTKGAHTVKVGAYRLEKGVWKLRKTIITTNYSPTTRPTESRYSAKTTLPYAGSWKLVAKTADDYYHAATSSAETRLTVK